MSTAIELAEAHLRRGKPSVQIAASERAEGWQVFVVVEFKTAAAGGRVWEKKIINREQLNQALKLLGIELGKYPLTPRKKLKP